MNFFLVETSFFFFLSLFLSSLLFFPPSSIVVRCYLGRKFGGRGHDRVALDADRGLRINR